jgi:hypothetical protein
MKKQLFILIVIFLLVGSFISSDGNQDIQGISTLYGKNNPICNEAIQRIRKTNKSDFISGSYSWGKEFETVKWLPLDGMSKTFMPEPFYVIIDINNDGLFEVAIKDRGMFRTFDFEHLYVVPKTSFEAFQRDTGTEEARATFEHTILRLSTDNTVIFTNGVRIVPPSNQIWQYKDKNYLVMSEAYFAHEDQYEDERELPNSLCVGILGQHQFDKDQNEQRMIPELLCQFKWK